MRTSKKSCTEDDCDGEVNEDSNTEKRNVVQRTKRYLKKIRNMFQVFLETEGWVIFVSIIMQDGPFFIVRMMSIFYYDILTYTNYFFAAKNVLIVTLQVYRIVSIYVDYKAAKDKEMKQKRKLHSYKPEYTDYTDLIRAKRQTILT